MCNKLISISLVFFLSAGFLFAEEAAYPVGGGMATGTSGGPKASSDTDGSALSPAFGGKDTGGKIDYHEFDLTDHSPSSAGVRSLLVPGWGQFFNGDQRKGALFFGVTAIVVAAAFSTYHDAQSSYDDYRADGRKDSSTYNDYSNKLNLTLILSGLAAVLWGVSIHDAAKNSNLAQSNAGTTLAFNKSGDIELVYQRKY